jgi:hypothetical protein
MNREQSKTLNWFFELLRVDLTKINYDDYRKMQIDFMTNGVLLSRGLEPNSSGFDRKALQKSALNVDEKIIKGDRDKFKKEFGGSLEEIQIILREQTAPIFEVIEKMQDGYDFLGDTILLRETTQTVELSVSTPGVYYYQDKNIIEDETPTLYIELNYPQKIAQSLTFMFIRNLHNIPIDRIKKCEECNGWFLQKTKANAAYCSIKCNSRKNSREKYRALDGEELAKAQKEAAERAHKMYVNNRPDHLKKTVVRRPLKYKED